MTTFLLLIDQFTSIHAQKERLLQYNYKLNYIITGIIIT